MHKPSTRSSIMPPTFPPCCRQNRGTAAQRAPRSARSPPSRQRALVMLVKTVPVASFIILALVWLSSKTLPLFIAALMVFPPVYLNVLEGVRCTDASLLEMARVFRVPFSRTLARAARGEGSSSAPCGYTARRAHRRIRHRGRRRRGKGTALLQHRLPDGGRPS